MDFSIVTKYLPAMLDGAWITVQITVISLLLGLMLALPLAMARMSPSKLLSWPAVTFILYFRGTPLLVQIFLIYYGMGQFRHDLQDLGLWTWFRDAWYCGILALTFNTACYTSEIFRGAIGAVPKGDREAATALGMSKFLAFRRVIFPKAFRIALPAYGNEIIFLLQATSLVSTITIMDLTFQARKFASKTFAVYEFYLTAAVMYLVITYALVFLFKILERKLGENPSSEPNKPLRS